VKKLYHTHTHTHTYIHTDERAKITVKKLYHTHTHTHSHTHTKVYDEHKWKYCIDLWVYFYNGKFWNFISLLISLWLNKMSTRNSLYLGKFDS
jgi:hypothetical protein